MTQKLNPPEEFDELTKPIIKWLNEHHHPHTCVLIDNSSAQLLVSIVGTRHEEFWKD